MVSGVLIQDHLAHALKQNIVAGGVCGWEPFTSFEHRKERVRQKVGKDKELQGHTPTGLIFAA